MFRRIILTLLILSIMPPCSFAKGGRSMLSKANKPFFSVQYDMAGCAYEIRINDVPVESNQDGLPITSWAPADEWLQSGDNTISLYLLPTAESKKLTESGQACEANVKFMIGNNDKPKEDDVPIASIRYTAKADNIIDIASNFEKSSSSGLFDSTKNLRESKDGDIKVDDITIKKIKNKYGSGVELSRTINMSIPFPHWKWLMSDKIANSEETKKELIKEYHKIWQALHDKNVQSITPLFKERTTELSEAYYKSFEEMSPIPDLEKEVYNDQVEQGGDIPDKYAYLHIFGNGHLAKITTWIGEAAIFFNYKDNSGSDNYDLIFRKEGDKWIITR